MVWDAQHGGTALRSKSFTMVPCQIPVNYEIAIPNSMTLGTGEKWLYQDEIIPSGQEAWRVFSPSSKGLDAILFS